MTTDRGIVSLPALLLFFIAVCHPGALPAAEPAVPETCSRLANGKEPARIVCFGDSITGVYYHTGGRRAYTDMLGIALQRLYPTAKIEMINAGISGNTTRDALARIEKDVLRHKPQLVTIMFGMNDVARVPIDEFRDNLRKIITQCRAVEAEVLLCTPNSIWDTGVRSVEKLKEYAEVIRQLASELRVPVTDCYQDFESVHTQSERNWRLLFSDDIHPNMDGHKRFAEQIAATISGRHYSLTEIPAPSPAIPRTLTLLRSGKPIKVLAMPPYDKFIVPALQAVFPEAQCEVTPWVVAGKTLAEIETDARKVRGMRPDLVIISVPADAGAPDDNSFQHSFSWTMNLSLSFGHQEWDCFCIPPSVTLSELDESQRATDTLVRRLIHAQDLGMISRRTNDTRPASELLTEWIRQQNAVARP